MLAFDPERSIARARRVLPEGGWEALSRDQRRLVMLAAAGMCEADGPSTQDERTALEHLAAFLQVSELAKSPELKGVDREKLREQLAETRRDRAFARHLFVATYLVGMGDGVLLDSERAFLDECAKAVTLEASLCSELESDLHGILYEELLETTYHKGQHVELNPRERSILNAAAKLLGLSQQAAEVIEGAYRVRLQIGGMAAY
ncbi:hypothetical protein HY251_20955 [bacterium]|nr:hypothetical protein [bacterium]